MRASILLLALAGCTDHSEWDPSVMERIPHQDKAEEIVWRQTYGETSPPPPIVWLWPSRLQCGCDDPVTGGFCTGFYRQGKCINGMYHPHGIAEVAVLSGYTFSSTTYAHELYHAHLERRGARDVNHEDPGFRPGGIVDRAVAAMRANGM